LGVRSVLKSSSNRAGDAGLVGVRLANR
jgi:hypothetical protein